MPIGIIAALAISTVLYGLVSLVSVLTVPVAELAASESPLAMVYERSTQNQPTVITSIGLAAVVNGALIQIIMVSRVLYGMSKNDWLPAVFGRVNRRTQTPVESTLLATAIIMMLALFVPLVALASVN